MRCRGALTNASPDLLHPLRHIFPATLGYETLGRPERPAVLGYETFGLPEPLGALGYETFGRPKRPATLGYETFGRPERPARLGYETFGCGAPLTWREAPCRFHVMRAARALPTEIRTDRARGVKAVSVFVLSLGHTVHVLIVWGGGLGAKSLVP